VLCRTKHKAVSRLSVCLHWLCGVCCICIASRHVWPLQLE
jgi:hypothetical protein